MPLEVSGLPLVELLWRDAEQRPSLLLRMLIQGSVSCLNVYVGRASLLKPSGGKAVSWTMKEKPGSVWIEGALLLQLWLPSLVLGLLS